MGYIICVLLCLDSWSSLMERHFIWQHFGMVPLKDPDMKSEFYF